MRNDAQEAICRFKTWIRSCYPWGASQSAHAAGHFTCLPRRLLSVS